MKIDRKKILGGAAVAILLSGCGEDKTWLTDEGKLMFSNEGLPEPEEMQTDEADTGEDTETGDAGEAGEKKEAVESAGEGEEMGGEGEEAADGELKGVFLNEGTFPVTKRIHELIMKTPQPKEVGEMKTYEVEVPKAENVKLKMVAIPGGEFMLGSPAGEAGREDDEGPRKKVKIAPMWMCEIEIPWAVYRKYYENGAPRHKDGTLKKVESKNDLADLVAQPTPQYMDMFVNGNFDPGDEYPAMEMTNHAANKFCQWLSAQTGHFYRLPTEAEWEYAARAGTDSAYYWGDDASKASEYGWFVDNSDFTYQKVKTKKPNAWGLYDMAGNVSEWVLDQYVADAYEKIEAGEMNPWVFPTKRYPRVFRGGNWDSDVDKLRSASRESSDKELKYQDPQVPKSVWYHTDAQHVGFRIVRPFKVPGVEMMHRYWNTDTGKYNKEDLGQ